MKLNEHKLKLALLFMARTLGVFKLFRFLTRNKLRVLCYHGGRIGDEGAFSPLMFASSELFARKIKWLQKKRFSFLNLSDAVELFNCQKKKPRLSTVITFDDGWYSTATRLVPILAELEIPSTLYLCTSHFLSGSPVPNVVVRYIIWASPLSSAELMGYSSELDGEYCITDELAKETLAKKVVNWISQQKDSPSVICRTLERFALDLGISTTDLDLTSQRFSYVSKDQLLQLDKGGCSIELHGHIHEYPIGNSLRLEEDLSTCRDVILRMGLPEPLHYCYPSGVFGDDFEMLKAIGIMSATTCLPGIIGKIDDSNRYLVPRFLDGDSISMLEFEAELSGFGDFVRSVTK